MHSISRNGRSLLTCLTALAVSLFSPPARCGEAFFSPDGKTVTTMVGLPTSITGLAQIDIATGKVKDIPLPKALAEVQVDSIAQGSEGEILFLANDTIWVIKDGQPAKKVASTAPVKMATGLVVVTQEGPLKDWILVSGVEDENSTSSGTFFGRKPGSKKFQAIFCRRVADASAGVYADDGRFFFASSGDLWEGMIEGRDDPEGWLGVLVGARLAPLGYLNTDEANSGSMWVDKVAPAGGWLYSALRGHHMGAIVRTPVPAKSLVPTAPEGEAPEFATLQDSYKAQAEALTKTENSTGVLSDHYSASGMASSG